MPDKKTSPGKYIEGGVVEINTLLSDMYSKYFDLVWYARRPPLTNRQYWDKKSIISSSKAVKAVERIKELYPVETANLSDIYEGDYFHGFNSGMLAAIRYLETAETDGIEVAENDFPDLDT